MGWLQRYLELFEGEPAWLTLLVSVILVTGLIVIVERLVKMSIWFLIVGAVATLVIVGGLYFLQA